MYWQPSSSLQALKARSNLNHYIREFFSLRQVMEVETPIISQASVADVNLKPVAAQVCAKNTYLHTSPEYAMKRLLAAGSGDIYQICKVFRDDEVGSRHNPEFTMLEYYRLRFDLKTLMDEVAQLVGDYLSIQNRLDINYQQAVKQYASVDAFADQDKTLRERVNEFVGEELLLSRDECLDIIMSHVVEPNLPKDCLVFIYDYPASQAALAKTTNNVDGHCIAKRFELYVNGLELANGYHELTDVDEQKLRFAEEAKKIKNQTEQASRIQDQNFIHALESGLPECSGVAIGLDRILMLKQAVTSISDVLAFDFSRA